LTWNTGFFVVGNEETVLIKDTVRIDFVKAVIPVPGPKNPDFLCPEKPPQGLSLSLPLNVHGTKVYQISGFFFFNTQILSQVIFQTNPLAMRFNTPPPFRRPLKPDSRCSFRIHRR
jgi:hypothetical protein